MREVLSQKTIVSAGKSMPGIYFLVKGRYKKGDQWCIVTEFAGVQSEECYPEEWMATAFEGYLRGKR